MAVNGNCVVWAQNKSTVTLGSFHFCCDSSKQRPYTMHSQFFWSSKLKCGSHLTSTMLSFYTNNINVMWKPMWKNLNGKQYMDIKSNFTTLYETTQCQKYNIVFTALALHIISKTATKLRHWLCDAVLTKTCI